MMKSTVDREVLPPLPTDDWAEEELGRAQLGDARRTRRLVQVATSLGAQPTASIPTACGSWAATKAAYRLFDVGARTDETVDIPAAIRAAHVQATVERLQR